MRRKKAPASWVRRVTLPVREFLLVDVALTQQALRTAPLATQRLFCAPSLFVLGLLDGLERAWADLRRPAPPSDPAE